MANDIRLLSGRVKKTPATEADPGRYDFLDLQNAEPDLGVPAANGNPLVSDTTGNRQWATVMELASDQVDILGNVDVTGNVTANYFIGNIDGANIVIIGNLAADYFIGNIVGNTGVFSDDITANNAVLANNLSAATASISGNITGGNLSVVNAIDTTTVVASGTVSTANLLTNAVSGSAIVVTGDTVTFALTGNVNLGGRYINSLANPQLSQDAATKQYVDDAVSAGIHIHAPVDVESPGPLPAATYTQGGTVFTVTDTVAGNTVVFGSAANLQVNDQLWFANSFQGIQGNVSYFVVSAPNTSAAVLSTAYDGEPVANITSASGLTESVRVNSGVGATLTATANGALIIDGFSLSAGNRALIYEQVLGLENGVYEVTDAGNVSAPWILTRATDSDRYSPDTNDGMDQGSYYFVRYGDTGAGESYVLTAPAGPFILGYDSIEFTQFSASQVYTANTQAGLDLNGTTFSAKTDGDTTYFDVGGNIAVRPGANLVTPNIGDAVGNSLTLTGNGLISAADLDLSGAAVVLGNVTGANINTAGVVEATGNVRGGNINTAGQISATGNVTGGNVSAVSAVTSATVTASGNVSGGNIDTSGQVSATGNVSGGNINTVGQIIATGNVSGGNVVSAADVTTVTVSASGNITGANLVTGGVVSAVGNVSGGNVNAVGVITAATATIAGNVSAQTFLGNIQGTTGVFSGNVTADYFIGNIQGNIDAGGANTQVQFNDDDVLAGSPGFTFNKSSNAVTVGGNVTAPNFLGNVQGTTGVFTGNVQADTVLANVQGTSGNFSGSVTAGNFVGTQSNVELVAGSYTWTFDDTGNTTMANGTVSGNILVLSGSASAASVSASGNVQANNVVSTNDVSGSTGTFSGNVSADTFLGNVQGGTANLSGNIQANNVSVTNGVTADSVTASGNIQGGNVISNADVTTVTVTASGNVQGGNISTLGIVAGGTGVFSGNVSAGNIDTSGALSVGSLTSSGNVTAANLVSNNAVTTVTLSASGNVTGGNVNTAGVVEATGNVRGGNITTVGTVSATGNVSGGNLVSQSDVTTVTVTASGNVSADNVNAVATVAATAGVFSGNVNATNVIASADILGDTVTAVGNVRGANVIANQAVYTGTVEATGNVQAANLNATTFVTAANAAVTYVSAGTLYSNDIQGSDIEITAANVDLVLNGNLDLGTRYINRLANPILSQDAATKQYVDDAVSAGLTIHPPVRLEVPTSESPLNATYSQGGVTYTVTDTVAGNTVVFSSAANLQVNDQLWFANSFQGIAANLAYFVVSTPNTSAAVLSTSWNGSPVSNITSGSALTESVRVNSGQGATLTNAGANATLVVDGVTVATNDRILVYNQVPGYENGVYVVTVAGDAGNAWVLTRAADMDTYRPDDINGVDAGDYFFVQEGNTGAGESYVMTDPVGPLIIGYSTLTFTQFSASSTYQAGNGLSLNGTIFSVNVDNDTTAIVADTVVVKTGANLVQPNIGNATGNSLTLTGNGLLSATTVQTSGNVEAANISFTTLLSGTTASLTGNIQAGNVSTPGNVTASGNVTANNAVITGDVSATTGSFSGNITAANFVGNVTGNITGNIAAAGSNTEIQFNNNSALGADPRFTFDSSGNATLSVSYTQGGTIQTDFITATGNVTGGNLVTLGQVSADTGSFTGNVSAANISATGTLTAATVSASGNITGNNLVSNNDVTTATVSASGNITGNNLVSNNDVTTATVTASGNVAGGNIITGGLVTATGNVTGGNVNTAGVVIATGNITGGNVISNNDVTTVSMSASGNITGNNLISNNDVTTTTVSATGNVNGGNIITGGVVSATGNVSGNYFIGNVQGNIASLTGNISAGNVVTSGIVDFSSGDATIGTVGTTAGWYYETSFSVLAQETEPRGLFFRSDGTRMYVAGNAGDDIIQYDLGTPWDVSTATYSNAYVVSGQGSIPYDVHFKSDGTVMYVLQGSNDDIDQYDLSVAWDVGSATFANKQFSVSGQESAPTGFWFRPDGTKMYVTGTSGDDVNEYDLGTAWDVSTASFLQVSSSLAAYETGPEGLAFSSDGTKMWIVGSTSNRITQFVLSSPWNISTLAFDSWLPIAGSGPYLILGSSGLYVDETAGKAYVSDYQNDRVLQYETNTPTGYLQGPQWTVDNDLNIGNNLSVNQYFWVGNTSRFVGAVTAQTSLSTPNLATTTSSGTSSIFTGVTTGILNLGTGITTGSFNVMTAQTTGPYVLGGTSATGAINIGRSTANQSIVIGNGVTGSGNVKTIDIGTLGAAGSTTNVTVGSSTAGAVNNINIYGNTTAGNITTTGQITATGNITTQGFFLGTFAGNISGNLTVPGANTEILYNQNGNAGASPAFTFDYGSNVLTVAGQANVSGNITADYYFGNGSQLTGIDAAGIQNGSSNIRVLQDSDITVSVNGVSNIAVFTDTGANITGYVTATGNITGDYFFGNGSQLTGIDATAIQNGTASVQTFLDSNVAISAQGNSNVAVFSGDGLELTGLISAGNIESQSTLTVQGNTIFLDQLQLIAVSANTFGVYESDGVTLANFQIGNVEVAAISSGNSVIGIDGPSGNAYIDVNGVPDVLLVTQTGVEVAGNVSAQYFLGNGSQLTGIDATAIQNGTASVQTLFDANVTVSAQGNANVAVFSGNGVEITGTVDSTGNISGNYILGNGSQLSGINSFGVIQVAGESDVAADSITDTLTLIAGSGILITTDSANDAIEITGTGQTSIFATGGNMGLVTQSVTAFENLGLITVVANVGYNLGSVVVDGVVINQRILNNQITGNKLASDISISTTGNISGSYIFGNGSQLTGLPAGYANSEAVAYAESGWAGNLIPAGNGVYSLGNSTNYWSNLWVANNTIYIGSVPLGVDGNVLTVGGQAVLTNDSNTSVSTSGNITAGNIEASLGAFNSIDVVGNITGTNLTVTGNVSANNVILVGTESTSVLQNNNDITGWYLTGNSFSVTAQETGPTGIFFRPDGTKMYIIGQSGDDITEYDLSVAWDITTASAVGVSANLGESTPGDLYISSDGTKCYITGDTGDAVREFTFGTAWQANTLTFVQSFSVSAQETSPTGITFRPDLTQMFIAGASGDGVDVYDLSEAGNIATASFSYFVSLSAQDTSPQAIQFNSDGTRFYMLGSTGDDINRYDLSTPYDLNTATFFNNSFYWGFVESTPTGMFLEFSQNRCWIVGSGSDRVWEIETRGDGLRATGDSNYFDGYVYAGKDLDVRGNTVVENTLTVLGTTTLSTTSISGSTTLSTTTGSVSLGTSQTSGATIIGGTSQTGSITVGRSTANQTVGIATGAVGSGSVKTIDIGTSGVSGSNTNITLGSATSGATTTITMYGNTTVGNLSTSGNIIADYFFGNGSQLSGIDATSIQNGTANVRTFLNGNVTTSAEGIANVLTVTGTGANVTGTLTTTGNITGGNLSGTNITGTLETSSQPNITSVGTLATLSVTGNITGGNLSGTNITGTLATAAQPNVTSLGTLTALSVTGNVTTGNVSGTNITGTLETASQPNITSVGTLTALSVAGNVTAGNVSGTNITGTLATAAQPNVTSVGTLTALSVAGNVTAGNVSGTNITGTLATAAQPNITSLGTLTALSVTGNITGGNLSATNIVGTLTTAAQPNITSLGTLTALSVTGNITGGNLSATNITGTVATASQPNITEIGTLATITVSGNASIGNVSTGNVTAASVTASGNVDAAEVNTDAVTAGSLLTITAGNLIMALTGDLDMGQSLIRDLGVPQSASDAATKQYVDDAVSSGIHIHDPVQLETPSALPSATYTQGGTTYTVTDTVAANTVVFSSAANLQVNDQLWFTNSFQGIVANLAYFVVSAPNTSAAVLSTTYNGEPVANITSASGLSQSVRVNPGVGATLTATANGALSVDGVSVSNSDRILVYNQSSQLENGVYTVTQTGNVSAPWILTRSTDSDQYVPDTNDGIDQGSYFFVQNGDTGAGESYVMTAPVGPFIIGYDSIEFTQFSASQVYSANVQAGISLTGTVFSARTDGVTTDFDAGGNIRVRPGAVLTTPNIGEATGTTLSLSGNIAAGNVSGTLISGTLSTAAQPNVTSLGTLTALTATGNVQGGNLVTSGAVSGNGRALTSLNASNLDFGTVPAARLSGTYTITVSGSATTAGTVTTAAQPNITSVGTLTALTVTGNVTGGNLNTAGAVVVSGSGAATNTTTGSIRTAGGVGVQGNIYAGGLIQATGNITGGNLSGTNIVGTLTTASQPNITGLGTITAGTWQGNSISTTYTDAKVTSVNGSVGAVTGVANTSGTLAQFASTTSSQLAGVISDETGSGSLVFATSPTLVTPVLGAATGTSLALTGGSMTTRASAAQDGVVISGRAGGTGTWAVTVTPTTLSANRTLTLANGDTVLQAGTMAITGGTLAQFAATTSSQLAGVISDETGSGSLVFATSPTLVTPVLGAATGTSLALTGGSMTTRASAAQDGIILSGRAGGTSTFAVTLTPTTLGANRTLTLPDNSGTILTTGATVTVAQGGTGQTSLTANNVLLGNGGSGVQVVAPGTNGNVLTSNGSTWISSAPGSSGVSTGKAIALSIIFNI